MPITCLLMGSKLEPEEVERLHRAFASTLKSLQRCCSAAHAAGVQDRCRQEGLAELIWVRS